MPDFSPELDNRLKALGIRREGLQRALIMIRDLRIRTIKANIDPKATRIAILFLELTDRHFAQQKLTGAELTELHLIAKALYEISKGDH